MGHFVLMGICDVFVLLPQLYGACVGWVTSVSVNKCVWLCCHTCVMYEYWSLLSVGVRVFGCVIIDV